MYCTDGCSKGHKNVAAEQLLLACCHGLAHGQSALEFRPNKTNPARGFTHFALHFTACNSQAHKYICFHYFNALQSFCMRCISTLSHISKLPSKLFGSMDGCMFQTIAQLTVQPGFANCGQCTESVPGYCVTYCFPGYKTVVVLSSWECSLSLWTKFTSRCINEHQHYLRAGGCCSSGVSAAAVPGASQLSGDLQ